MQQLAVIIGPLITIWFLMLIWFWFRRIKLIWDIYQIKRGKGGDLRYGKYNRYQTDDFDYVKSYEVQQLEAEIERLKGKLND